MNDSTTTNMVHEAEVQRQHMRVQLPIKIEIGQHRFEVADWSHQGIALYTKPLQAHNITLKKGDIIDINLIYEFGGFSLTMPMKCEVRHLSSDGSKAGCRFSGLNERNTSLLQYLVSAYVSGDMVHVGDVLDVASRKNYTTARKLPNIEMDAKTRFKRKIRHLLNVAALVLLALSVLAYSGLGIYERVYVVQANVAAVVPNLNIADGNTALIEASIPYADAIKLGKNMKATLGFPAYKKYMEGTIKEVILESVQLGTARVYILPSESIPDAWMRMPVEVKIDTRQSL